MGDLSAVTPEVVMAARDFLDSSNGNDGPQFLSSLSHLMEAMLPYFPNLTSGATLWRTIKGLADQGVYEIPQSVQQEIFEEVLTPHKGRA